MKKIIILSLTLILFINYFSSSQDRRKLENDKLKRTQIRNENPRLEYMNLLRLNEDQKKEFEIVQKKYNHFFTDSRKSLKKRHLELELEKMNDNLNLSKIDNLIDEISKIKSEEKKMTFRKDNELRSILDDRQVRIYEGFKKRRKMIARRSKEMIQKRK
mgnify:CR=1 FL=1